MGANIKLKKLENCAYETETSRVPRNFVKGHELDPGSFISCDHITFFTGGEIAPHKHEDLEETFYFLRGTGIVKLDDEEIEVQAGSVVVSPPGTYHAVKNTGKDILTHIVCSAKVDK